MANNSVIIDVIAVDKASSVFGNIGAALGRIAFAATAAGIALISKTLIDSVKSAIESEKATAQLNAVLKSTQYAAGLSIEALQDQATALQAVTTFSDEVINSGQAMLLTFTNIGKDVFPMATEAVLNMAQEFGSVDQAAVQLGKALNNPIEGLGALQRIGVKFTKEQKKLVEGFMLAGDIESAQKIILQELAVEFGGLAKAMGQTTEGKLKILANQLDNLKEKIGGPLLGLLVEGADAITNFINSADFTDFFDALVSGDWETVMGTIADKAREMVDAFARIDWSVVSANIIAGINSVDWNSVGDTLGDGLIAAWEWASQELKDIATQTDWSGLFESGSNALMEFLAGFTQQGSWDNVLTTWANNWNMFVQIINNFIPIVVAKAKELIAQMGLAFIVGGPVIAAQVASWLPVISTALKQITNEFIAKATGWIMKAVETLLALKEILFNAISEVIMRAKAAIKPISFTINLPNFEQLAQQAADGFEMVQNAIAGNGVKGGKSTNAGGGGGNKNNTEEVASLASGGVVSGPRSGFPAVLHGTEAVVPLGNGRSIPVQMQGGGGMVINLTYAPAFSMADKSEFQNKLMPFIMQGIREARRA
jgi:hypothetical protein